MLFAFLSLALAAGAAAKAPACDVEKLPKIDVPGIEVVKVHAVERKGYTDWAAHLIFPLPTDEGTPLDFCNVTVSYTHPGQNDLINTWIWLPSDDSKWNGKYHGSGGCGWAAAMDNSLGQSVNLGYATAKTDAGHNIFNGFDGVLDARNWALTSPGNINWVNIQNFASRAYDDLPQIAKQVIKGFYGKEPKHSLWSGCSTGGRQGLITAQRYPKHYDGILAVAPAINWATFLVTESWPQLVMRKHKYFPSQCELEAIRQEAIKSCDLLDGVKDGIISAPGLCTFDATKAVGKPFGCGEDTGKISRSAAKVANDVWDGPKRNGQAEWFGSVHDMPFGGPSPLAGLANTMCDEQGKNCKPWHWALTQQWIQLYLKKDPEFDVDSITEDDFWSLLGQSRKEFSSIMGSDDPDLSEYKANGGKIIMWHGLADQLIFPNGSSNYYERVLEKDPKAKDFFRYFEVPGLLHCAGGPGAHPLKALETLEKWVESGTAPETLEGEMLVGGAKKQRIFCPYPLVAAYKGGDDGEASSFECAESFDKHKQQWSHGEL